MLAITSEISSILECGCNIGRNIELLNFVIPESKKLIIEISKPAYSYVITHFDIVHGFDGSIVESEFVGH